MIYIYVTVYKTVIKPGENARAVKTNPVEFIRKFEPNEYKQDGTRSDSFRYLARL